MKCVKEKTFRGRRGVLFVAGVCAAVILFFASCAKKEEAGKAPPLRVAYLATVNYLTLLSQDKALLDDFSAKGIRFEFIGPSSPFDAINIVSSANADATSTGTGRFLNLVSQGGKWTAFALEKYSGDSQGIAAAPGSGVETLRDLYGKKIGISQRGATGDYIVNTVFAWAGLDVTQVEKVELSDADYSAAFTSGRIAALATYDQHFANALSVPGAKKLVDGTQYGSLNWSIHFARKDFAEKYPDILKGAYKALRAMSAKALADNSLITNAYRELGASEVQIARIKTFDTPRILPMDAEAVADLNKQARQYTSYGFLSSAPEDFAPHVIDFSGAD
jgi:sulfonate transport system substrate-binding protein